MEDVKKDLFLEDHQFFAVSRRHIGEERFKTIVLFWDSMEALMESLIHEGDSLGLPAWFPELVAMEAHAAHLRLQPRGGPVYSPGWIMNPGLKLFSNTWKHLTGFIGPRPDQWSPGQLVPILGEEQVMVWPAPDTGLPLAEVADHAHLLILKMVLENVTPDQVVQSADIGLSEVNSLILQALNAGIVLGPEPGILRSNYSRSLPGPRGGDEAEESYLESQDNLPHGLIRFSRSRVFALQWHITQACDLHCRHCYDRTPSAPLPLVREIGVLDSLSRFCDAHDIFGQVTFTGGNPLLHSNFLRLYQEAADRGFFLGILGNPTTIEMMDAINSIQVPSFFQVSLEGLEPHNDYIRGPGHFKRVMAFLDILKQKGVYSKVMLTLTQANMDQVLSLGEILRGRTDQFTFNRLSLEGEGANLVMAEIQFYESFLGKYVAAAKENHILGLKDNLFNILHEKNKEPLFGGCTGHGCGAAFNFVSLLPTGEVHACRKFPSPLGNITHQSLSEIYHSKIAEKYRRGPEACWSCRMNLVCRGCMASSHSHDLDVFIQKDPYCFM